MASRQDGKHHRVCDRLTKANFEGWAGQSPRALTLGFAVAGRDLESASNASAFGRFNVICLIANQPGRFQIERKRGSRL